MINRLTFSIQINAEKSKIWAALWNDTHYRDWANVFSDGSHAITENWKVGSTVMFVSPELSGIYSIIDTHIPNKVMKFRHIGVVVEGKEQAQDDDVKKWTGATETYTLTEGSEGCTLSVDIDVLDEHLDFMKERFPLALEKVKKNSK